MGRQGEELSATAIYTRSYWMKGVADGRCGWSLGGWKFAMVEEVGSGCKIERLYDDKRLLMGGP